MSAPLRDPASSPTSSTGVLVVTINRPEARNAINTETAVAIGAAMDALDDDRATWSPA